MQGTFIQTWKRILAILLGIEIVGWIADGLIWQFWLPVEWFRLFGELFLAWGIVMVFAIAFRYAKKTR